MSATLPLGEFDRALAESQAASNDTDDTDVAAELVAIAQDFGFITLAPDRSAIVCKDSPPGWFARLVLQHHDDVLQRMQMLGDWKRLER